MLLGICMMLAFGCKQVNSPLEATSENGQTIEGLNINVKYAESYDQTEITYSRIWPEGISAGFDKSKSTSGGELLVDYERTNEVLAYDEEGYMSSVTEFLEGDGEMNMPEDTYNKLKSTMPAKSADYDPIVKIEYINGVEKRIGKSGNTLYETTYDEELFRIDVDLLDSLKSNENQRTDESIRRNIERLENDGIDFQILEGRFASFNIKASSDLLENGIVKLRYLEDLQSGEIIRQEFLNKEGNPESIIFSAYKNIAGSSVLFHEESFFFGEINGKWGVTHRSAKNKTNFKIIKN